MLFNPTLKEVRQFFYHAWHKSLANQALAPIETIAVKWMRVHPEYHAVLNGPIEALESAQFLPEDGQTNPFLHLSMHLSLSEQYSMDRPSGIRQSMDMLAAQLLSLHAAHHAAMGCLASMIDTAQRTGQPLDGATYLACVQRQITKV